MKKGVNRGEIEIYTPEDQKHKTPEQLMSMVSSYMIDEIIKKLPKTSGKKKLSEKILILSTKQIELQHVLLHMSMRLKKKGKIQIDKRDEKNYGR